MKSDVGLSDFVKYPKLLKAQIRAYQKFLDANPDRKFYKEIDGSAYNGFYYRLFCKTHDDYINAMNPGMFPEAHIETKAFLEKYFGIDLTI